MEMDNNNQTDVSLPELQHNQDADSTMEWTTAAGQEVQLQRNTTEQPIRDRRSTRNKKKRKKKKTWLFINNNDFNTYYRPSKYLKMPYKLLHHTLSTKLQHPLIKNKERMFVLSRLRLLDELCYMDTLHQLWQNYYHIGIQHQLWSDHIKKIIRTRDINLIQQFVDEHIFQMQHRLNVCNTQCISQAASCPSTLSINLIDEQLKKFALSHQKHLFRKMNSEIRQFKEQIQEKQLFNSLNCQYFTIEKRELFNRVVNIRENQLQFLEELLRLEQHILCRFLPKAYSQIDYDMAPANLNSVAITGSNLLALTNNTKKMTQLEKRRVLQNEFQRYETIIQDYEYQYQQGLIQLQQCFTHQTYNGISFIDMITNYFTFKTENTLHKIMNNLPTFRIQLIRCRRRFMAKKLKIDPSPEVMIDVPEMSFTNDHIAYLSLGPSFIRLNQSWLLSRTRQNKWIEKEHKKLMDKITPYLRRQYSIQSEYSIMKHLSVQLKNQLHHHYATSLSSRDVLRTRKDFRIMKSIRRKLRRRKLILRLTDKSNIFYICRAIDFEKKVQAYRERTNAYQELTSNPLEDILYKVTRLLNDLRAQNFIQANQHKEMIPLRTKVRLGYMYFNPKVHKKDIPLRPIISSIRAPTTAISRFLDNLLRPLFDLYIKKTRIINGLDLIRRVNKYTTDGYLKPTTIFCTFDITDLYTMLPQKQSLDILKIFLEEHNIEKVNTMSLDTILQLAHIVLNENAFIYDKKYYKQILGGAMGSPFTMTLANIFLWYWEKDFVADLHSSNEIYGRYIDDVFFTWNESLISLQTILKNLNDKHTNIKLVYEIGTSVSFLDVFIKNENGILSTSIYHKDAAEPYILPFISDHPPHIFRNIINGTLVRAAQYSSTFDAFNNERRYIRLKLLYNGYPSKYIDSQFRKFFAKHNIELFSSSLPLLSFVDTSDKFFVLRNRLLNKLDTPSKKTTRNTIAVIIDKNRPTHVTVKKIWQTDSAEQQDRLIIHIPYEHRFRSLRKNVHQLWSTVFENTNVLQTKLIVGTMNRRNNKLELVQAYPNISLITLPRQNRP